MPLLPRVLLLNYEFPPMGGGAGHASFQIAKTLVKRGCSVDVITSSVDGSPMTEMLEGVRVFRVPSRRKGIHDCGYGGAWTYVMTAHPVLEHLLKESHYDVAHYFFGLPTGTLLLSSKRARRIPSVVSLRGSDVPGYDPGTGRLVLAHRLLGPVTRQVWRTADAVVANSEALRQLAGKFFAHKQIEVITNAIEGDHFLPAARNGHVKPTVHLLAVARLIQRKGLDDLLEALALLKNEPVHLTIQGTGGQQESLEQLALNLGIYERVTFAGFCLRERLPDIYRQADIFVLPSHSESFSMAVLEAMACGLPVVACRIGGMNESVEHGVSGLLVSPRNPGELAEAIRRLVRDPVLRKEMGQAGAGRARAQFSWDRVTDEYLAVYQRIMALRGESRHARR